jgi:phage terminase small subunit
MAKRSNKAGSGKDGAAHRRKLFLDAYLANGRNATQAAITAGFSKKTAGSQGYDLLKHPEIVAALETAVARIEAISGLSVERTLQEIARVAYQDPRKLYDGNGNLKPVHELDDDMAASVASVEVTEEFEGHGQGRTHVGYTKKIKLWDKNSALVTAARHLGLFEKDNAQRGESLALQVVLVAPPNPRP